jgi:hypothetical protein
MYSQRAYFGTLAALLTLIGSDGAFLATAEEKVSNVQIRVVGSAGSEYPDAEALLVEFTLHPGGRLSSHGTLEYTDEKLREFLKEGSGRDRTKPLRFRLHIEKEKDVSVQLLGKTLQRFRNCADPKGSYVIYLVLTDIVPVEQKKDK